MQITSQALNSPTTQKRKFLNSINYFRAIAIIIIVLSHSYDLAQWEINSVWSKFCYSLSQNGSVFFIFISGFLFHHIFYFRFQFQKFMVKKLNYVFLPYLIMSFLPLVYQLGSENGGIYLPSQLQDNLTLATLWYLATGKMMVAYWYIPVAMMLYFLSPVVIKLINHKTLGSGILALMPISLIVHRPIANINPLHSLIYFLPVYLLGVWCSINKQKIYVYLANKIWLVLNLSLLLALYQSLFFEVSGNFHKEFWSVTVIDINLIQKILLCFFLMSLLNLYENTDNSFLKKTAEVSFPIYFIHPLLIMILAKVIDAFNLSYQGNFLTLLIATTVLLLGSMAIAFLGKSLLNKKSRYIIGW